MKISVKKTLAACLTAALLLSGLSGAGAAYSDQSAITQTQAVEALTDRGILNGKSDGSFDPQGLLTRAEMAKMICVLETGSADASAYAGLAAGFTDIETSWAASYIRYAVSRNILAGRSETIFDPTASVTGLEEGKMLLVYLGYDPDEEGLTGASWAENTQTLGDSLALFDGVSSELSQAVTREDAARLMYNALQIKETESAEPAEPDTGDWDSGQVTRGENNYMAGMVVNSYIAQNSDGDKRVYLDLLTADGKKTGVETDLSASSSGATILQPGSLISFWGTDYTSIEELAVYNYGTRLTADRNYAAVKSFNESTDRVSFYSGLACEAVETGFTAAKITGDTLVLYVDQSDSDPANWKVLQEGELTAASQGDEEGSYTANCFVSLSEDDSSEINLLVIEVNGEIRNDQQQKVTLREEAAVS